VRATNAEHCENKYLNENDFVEIIFNRFAISSIVNKRGYDAFTDRIKKIAEKLIKLKTNNGIFNVQRRLIPQTVRTRVGEQQKIRNACDVFLFFFFFLNPLVIIILRDVCN